MTFSSWPSDQDFGSSTKEENVDLGDLFAEEKADEESLDDLFSDAAELDSDPWANADFSENAGVSKPSSKDTGLDIAGNVDNASSVKSFDSPKLDIATKANTADELPSVQKSSFIDKITPAEPSAKIADPIVHEPEKNSVSELYGFFEIDETAPESIEEKVEKEALKEAQTAKTLTTENASMQTVSLEEALPKETENKKMEPIVKEKQKAASGEPLTEPSVKSKGEAKSWDNVAFDPKSPNWKTPQKAKEEVKIPAGVSLADLASIAPKAKPSMAERQQQSSTNFLNKEDTAFLKTQATEVELANRYRQDHNLWSQVSRISGFIAQDSFLQQQLKSIKLTNDHKLDIQQRRLLEDNLAPKLINASFPVASNPKDAKTIFDMVYDEITGISVLGPLWRDDAITEILVLNWNKVVVERSGVLANTPIKFQDLQHAQSIARNMAQAISGRALSPATPMVTAELPGARVNFAYAPVARSGISIAVRKFPVLLSMDKLYENHTLNNSMREFLKACVIAKATILVSGGTGTGKTTMINALSESIPATEYVITIEDNFELQLSNELIQGLQTKEKASADDEIIISQAELFINTLRMRPDRIIVGEIRDGEGASVMLRAANTGHDGTMTTVHANSAEAAVNERMVDLLKESNARSDETAKRTIATGIDLVIQVTRRTNGTRFISEISLVDRTCIKNNELIPDKIFTGDVNSQGKVEFKQVGIVRPDTTLGLKLLEAGYDLNNWELSE